MGVKVEIAWEEIACIGIKEMKDYKVMGRKLATEFLGTYIYIFIGCCSIVSHDWQNHLLQSQWIVFGLAFGLGAHCSVIFAGHISSHFNPAVTVGMFIIGECSILRGVAYIIVQLLAGIAALGTIVFISPHDDSKNSRYASCVINMTPVAKGLIPETIGVFLLVLTMAVVLDHSRKDVKGSPALAIGMCLAAANMHCYYFTGASFNPARRMAASIYSDVWGSTWIYWLAPIMGTSFAGLLYRFVFTYSGFPPADWKGRPKKEKKEEAPKEEAGKDGGKDDKGGKPDDKKKDDKKGGKDDKKKDDKKKDEKKKDDKKKEAKPQTPKEPKAPKPKPEPKKKK